MCSVLRPLRCYSIFFQLEKFSHYEEEAVNNIYWKNIHDGKKVTFGIHPKKANVLAVISDAQ